MWSLRGNDEGAARPRAEEGMPVRIASQGREPPASRASCSTPILRASVPEPREEAGPRILVQSQRYVEALCYYEYFIP